MRVLIAPDSFKECLSATAVAEAIATGWCAARADDDLQRIPIADGGEGTVDALLAVLGGTRHTARVCGPMGTPVDAVFGVLADRHTAIVEMAAASGLHLVAPGARNPLHATSRGTGELLLAAARVPGVQHIVLGIGGSATNDGGAGFAEALGVRLEDAAGAPLPPGGAALARLARVDMVLPALPRITVACDVENPLLGPRGASAIFGPQKGARPAQLEQLDAALGHYAALVEAASGRAVCLVPGAGAAGGLGFALMAFTQATLRPGFDIVAEATGLEAAVAACDLVITGEGRVDGQSAMGKVVGKVLRMAQEHGVPAVVLAGALGEGHACLDAFRPYQVVAIAPESMPLAVRLAQAEALLRVAAREVANAFPGRPS